MYKRSKTDNRFFLDISKPGNISPAKMPKSLQKKTSKTTLNTRLASKFEHKKGIYGVTSNDDNKKWKKTDEWKPLW